MLMVPASDAPTRPVLRWLGGKYRLAKWIISHFPAHRVYVEPFGGAASVLLQKPRAYNEVYNDRDGELVNLFRVLRGPDAPELLRLLAMTPYARSEYVLAFDLTDDPVERARRTVVRSHLAHGTGGARIDRPTGLRVDGRSGTTDVAGEWAKLPAAMEAVVARMQGVVIEQRPAAELLAKYDDERVLIYLDPPYMPATRSTKSRKPGERYHTYAFEMTADDHVQLLDAARQSKAMIVLSGYPDALYDAMLRDWTCVTCAARAHMNSPRTEGLWINPLAASRMDATVPNLPKVRFTGDTGFLLPIAGLPTGTAGGGIFVMGEANAGGISLLAGYGLHHESSGGVAGYDGMFRYAGQAGDQVGGYRNGPGDTTTGGVSLIDSANTNVVADVERGGAGITRVGGGTATATQARAINTNGASPYAQIGVFGTSPMTCSVQEVIFLNRAPTDDEIYRIEGYLAWRWGQDAKLPANHAYKSAPPERVATGTTNAGVGVATGTSISTGQGSARISATAASTGTSVSTASGRSTARATSTVTGTAAASAAGVALRRTAGASAGSATVSGAGRAARSGAGSSAGVGSAAGAGRSFRLASGSTTGTSVSTAVGNSVATANGTATGTSVSAGASSTQTLRSATGAATGTSISSGAGAARVMASGSSAGTSTSSAAGGSTGGGTVGMATGSAVVTGAGAAQVTAAGTSINGSNVAGVGRATAAGSGASSGTSTVSATAITIASASGTAAGSSNGAGVGASVATAAGASSGAATASAAGQRIASTAGTASGSSSATAASSATAQSSGASFGSAPVSGAGTAVKGADGTATAETTADGQGQARASAIGTSAGSSFARAQRARQPAPADRRVTLTGGGSRTAQVAAGGSRTATLKGDGSRKVVLSGASRRAKL